MNDDKCNVLVEAIKELTSAVQSVAENVSDISSYYDGELINTLRKELRIIAQVIEEQR